MSPFISKAQFIETNEENNQSIDMKNIDIGDNDILCYFFQERFVNYRKGWHTCDQHCYDGWRYC